MGTGVTPSGTRKKRQLTSGQLAYSRKFVPTHGVAKKCKLCLKPIILLQREDTRKWTPIQPESWIAAGGGTVYIKGVHSYHFCRFIISNRKKKLLEEEQREEDTII